MAALAGFDWGRAASASEGAPLRVLVSACIAGRVTGWQGIAYPDDAVLRLLALPNVAAFPFCPEDLHLGTPRPFTTCFDGNGEDVLEGRARVLETTGRDVTAQLVAGAEAMRDLALRERVHLAVLLDVSDSCGTNVVYLGPPEDKRYQRGPGVAAAMLRRAGVPTLAQRDFASFGRLLATLDPSYVVPADAADFVDHPWYRETFGD